MGIQQKVKLILLFIIIFLMICSVKVLGASISVTPSKSSVSPGESFSVNISASGATGKVSISASNGSVSNNTLWLEPSGSITVTAGSSGSVKISVVAVDMSDNSGNEVSPSGSATVSIVTKTVSSSGSSGGYSGGNSSGTTTKPKEVEKSSDSSLKELTIKEGKISPEFKNDVKEYTLSVPYETSEVNVTATTTDSKATVEVKDNKDLKEGENVVTVNVTAEDGSTSRYIIKVTRARVPLSLKSLVVKYTNQEGELIEIPVNPEFSPTTLEYTLQDLEYWVENLSIEAITNIAGATVDIQGAENLQIGENTITITAKIEAQNSEQQKEEAPKEEIITYTIKVNKLEEPTLMAKISNWFGGLMGTIKTWFKQNEEKVIVGSLVACNVALLGLSVYIVVDYKKYKDVIAKVKKAGDIKNANIIEEIHESTNFTGTTNIDENTIDKQKSGKHF